MTEEVTLERIKRLRAEGNRMDAVVLLREYQLTLMSRRLMKGRKKTG